MNGTSNVNDQAETAMKYPAPDAGIEARSLIARTAVAASHTTGATVGDGLAQLARYLRIADSPMSIQLHNRGRSGPRRNRHQVCLCL
jgi:hypothetical protein